MRCVLVCVDDGLHVFPCNYCASKVLEVKFCSGGAVEMTFCCSRFVRCFNVERCFVIVEILFIILFWISLAV